MFELADTGTLFLDEIGELPINLQSALLRVLQDHEVTRVGGQKSKKVDVRIVAATNQNLEEMIEEGTFRSDLYYRLNVVSINIPPLRERKDDIPKLAEKTLENLNQKYGVHKVMSPHFIRHLLRGDWPGNVRELRNFIEKQFVLSDETILDAPVTSSFCSQANTINRRRKQFFTLHRNTSSHLCSGQGNYGTRSDQTCYETRRLHLQGSRSPGYEPTNFFPQI